MENATVSADDVIDGLIDTLLADDPTLSYTQFMDIRDLYVKRFIRYRKIFLAKHSASFSASLNLKRVVPSPGTHSKKPRVKDVSSEPVASTSVGGHSASTESDPNTCLEERSESASQAESSHLDDSQHIQTESVDSAIAAAVSSIERYQQEQVVVTTAEGLSGVLSQQGYDTQAQRQIIEGDQTVIIVERPSADDQFENV